MVKNRPFTEGFQENSSQLSVNILVLPWRLSLASSCWFYFLFHSSHHLYKSLPVEQFSSSPLHSYPAWQHEGLVMREVVLSLSLGRLGFCHTEALAGGIHSCCNKTFHTSSPFYLPSLFMFSTGAGGGGLRKWFWIRNLYRHFFSTWHCSYTHTHTHTHTPFFISRNVFREM